jgi:hypothetical protein
MANSPDISLSEEDKVRFKLLYRTYAISKGYKFVHTLIVNLYDELMARNEKERQLACEGFDYLQNSGLIDSQSIGNVSITREGINEFESAILKPCERTNNFPIHISDTISKGDRESIKKEIETAQNQLQVFYEKAKQSPKGQRQEINAFEMMGGQGYDNETIERIYFYWVDEGVIEPEALGGNFTLTGTTPEEARKTGGRKEKKSPPRRSRLRTTGVDGYKNVKSEAGFDLGSFFEHEGSGTVFYNNGLEIGVDFSFQMLQNGSITGRLKFHEGDQLKLLECLTQNVLFRLDGYTSQNLEITIEECFPLGYSQNMSQIESKFTTQRVSINPKQKKSVPESDLAFDIGLVNLPKVFRVSVQTELGELFVQNYAGIEESVNLMQHYGISLITSVAKMSIKIDGRSTMEEHLIKVKGIVQNLLKITTLAYTTWIDWAFIAVYQREKNSDDYLLACADLNSPKTKSSRGIHLTSLVQSSFFIDKIWRHYSSHSKELNEKYGFDYALEWYVESSSPGNYETNFLRATTAFELLMERFHSQRGTEFILDEKLFDEVYNALHNFSRDWMKQRFISSDLRKSIYLNLMGANRRHYEEKGRMLINHWRLLIDDLGINVSDIVKVRNEITHRGRYGGLGNENPSETLEKAYFGVFSILTRIFLAMLSYDGEYYDASLQRTVNQRYVCKKLGTN